MCETRRSAGAGDVVLCLLLIVLSSHVCICAESVVEDWGDLWIPPSNWTWHDGHLCYIPPLVEDGCVISLELNIDSGLQSYTATDFESWYRPGAFDVGVLSVASSGGNTTVDVDFVANNWESVYAENEAPNEAAYGYCRTWAIDGRIQKNIISVNFETYHWDTGIDSEKQDVSQIIGHELGHAVGMDHTTQDCIMDEGFARDRHFSDFTKSQIACVYGSPYLACITREAPAYFQSVVCSYDEHVGVTLSLETFRENGVTHIDVKRAVGWSPAYVDYDYIGRIDLVSPYGGAYEFVDEAGERLNHYLLECVSAFGHVDNSIYIQCDNGSYSLAYSTDHLSEMRDYNLSQTRGAKWRSIAQGLTGVSSVHEVEDICCDYLVIAYEGFVDEIAPICGYWESVGVNVDLLSCDGLTVSPVDVKQIVEYAYSSCGAKTVWLVGSSKYDDSYGLDLVPDGVGGDFYYSDLDDDFDIDIPVGRLPARSEAEVVYYANKELHYHLDVRWGGRKDPAKYSVVQLNSIPDNRASTSKEDWTADQYLVADSSFETYGVLRDALGADRVSAMLSTQLTEWYLGDNAQYFRAVSDAMKQDMIEGRHVVFGHSLHNSSSTLYGVVPCSGWSNGIVYRYGQQGGRGCETFWVTPMCYSANTRMSYRHGLSEPVSLYQHSIPVYELFANRGLVILGSNDLTWHNVSRDVNVLLAEAMFVEDPVSGERPSLGGLWMDVHNLLLGNSIGVPAGLLDYVVLGDPMLFVRDVYSDDVSVDGSISACFDVSVSPSPMNSTTRIEVSWVTRGEKSVTVFDLRGRLVDEWDVSRDDSVTVLTWDGTAASGEAVPSGKYFVVASEGGRKSGRAITVVK